MKKNLQILQGIRSLRRNASWQDLLFFFPFKTYGSVYEFQGRLWKSEPLNKPGFKVVSLIIFCLRCVFQIWRPVTATFFFPTGFQYLINLYFLYHYSTRLETGKTTGLVVARARTHRLCLIALTLQYGLIIQAGLTADLRITSSCSSSTGFALSYPFAGVAGNRKPACLNDALQSTKYGPLPLHTGLSSCPLIFLPTIASKSLLQYSFIPPFLSSLSLSLLQHCVMLLWICASGPVSFRSYRA